MYCFLGCFKTDSGNRCASAQGGQTAEEQHAANRGSSHSLLLGRGEGGGLGSSPGGGLLLANERRIVAVGFPSNCELHFIGKHAQPVFIQAPRIV